VPAVGGDKINSFLIKSTTFIDIGAGVWSNKANTYLAKQSDMAVMGSSSGNSFSANSNRASRKCSYCILLLPTGFDLENMRSTSCLPIILARSGAWNTAHLHSSLNHQSRLLREAEVVSILTSLHMRAKLRLSIEVSNRSSDPCSDREDLYGVE
jgi:hypothetical protein